MSGGGPPICVLAGGVGAARFLRGLLAVVDPRDVTAIVNVGDDATIHGLEISPDLDTITYTLAGAIDPARGWGLAGETWRAIEQVRRYADANGITADGPGNDAAGWFLLGDGDLGTHLYRTSRRSAGVSLSQVTAEITHAWGLGLRLLPVTDDALRTRVITADDRDLSFQEYFVREQHAVAVREVRLDGAATARPGPEVLEAITGAEAVVIAPSNPVVSIDPVLAVPGVREAVTAARARTVAVSPIVGGAALKGPADRLLRELGRESSVVGIARWYAELAATLVIDTVDETLADDVAATGMRCVVAPTVMADPGVAAALARTCLSAVGIAA
jgi:LPPG:FO 2-phospho-L-lactate transferase